MPPCCSELGSLHSHLGCGDPDPSARAPARSQRQHLLHRLLTLGPWALHTRQCRQVQGASCVSQSETSWPRARSPCCLDFTCPFSSSSSFLNPSPAGKDKSILLWDVDACTTLGPPLLGHAAEVFSIDFGPVVEGAPLLLVSGSHDTTLRLWSISLATTTGAESADAGEHLCSRPPTAQALASVRLERFRWNGSTQFNP